MERKDRTAELRHTIIITVDVEADGGGFPGGERTFESFRVLPRLLQVLSERKLPLTAFVEGEILENHVHLIEPLIDYGAVIESHAYDHSCVGMEGGARTENMERGLAAYQACFSEPAWGFRAPQGIIGRDEMSWLARVGVRYDSSVCPCFFPGRFNNFSTPLSPYRHIGTDLLELPLGALGGTHYPIALSYIQLVGWQMFRLLFLVSPKPPCFIFNFHLHDLCRGEWYMRSHVPKTVQYGYRATLRRDPFAVFLCFLDFVIEHGFCFVTTREWIESLEISMLSEYLLPDALSSRKKRLLEMT